MIEELEILQIKIGINAFWRNKMIEELEILSLHQLVQMLFQNAHH